MLNIKFIYLDANNPNKVLHTTTGQFEEWNQIMTFGETHAESLMELLDLPEIVWTYETFDLVLSNGN